ncbi:MAG: O-antigen ligase family protein [Anaerolineae bacterium]
MTSRPGADSSATRQTVADRLAVGLTEAAYLAALAVVPLYFNPRSERVFEPDKLAWIVVLALLALWALVVRLLEPHRRSPRAWLAAPIPVAAAVAVAALALGASLSVVPGVSWLGLYVRGQGVVAYACLAVLLAAVASACRSPGVWERLALTVALSTVPVSLYAILQRFGIDNVVWSAGSAEPSHRSFGALGNPIFLGAFLILALPIAAAELLRSLSSDGGSSSPSPRGATDRKLAPTRRVVGRLTAAPRWRVVGLSFAIALSLTALLLSQSRGPVLGLIAAAAAYALLWAATEGRGRLAVGLSGAGIAVAATFLALGGAGAGSVGRLGGLLSMGSRTARERILLWEALGDLLASDPARALLGYGPETTGFVVARYLPAELVRLAPDQIYDRAHNIVWEWWVSAGVVGALAILALHGAALVTAYRVLGLTDDRRGSAWLTVTMATGSGLGVVASLVVPPAGAFAAVGAAFGLLAGAAAYAVVRSMRPSSTAAEQPDGDGVERARPVLAGSPDGTRYWIALGFAALTVAHLVEGSLGLPTASSELLFWVGLGALAGAAAAGGRRDDEQTLGDAASGAAEASNSGVGAKSPRKKQRTAPGVSGSAREPTSRESACRSRHLAIADGLASGLVVAAAIFAPILVADRSTPLGHPAVWSLLVVTWLCAELLRWRHGGADWSTQVARLAVVMGLAVLVMALRNVPAGEVIAFGAVLAGATAALGWALSTRAAPVETTTPGRWAIYAVLGVLLAVAAWRIALTPVMADTHIRSGLRYAASGDIDSAQREFETAVAMWPSQPEYASFVSAVLHERMRRGSTNTAEADAYHDAAARSLIEAFRQAPVEQHMVRLALLHRDRGDMEEHPTKRLEYWEQARGALATALRQAPLSPEALAENAGVMERLGDVPAAREGYARALDLGAPSAYWSAGLARAALAEGDVAAGTAAVEQVISLSGDDAGKAEAVLAYPDGLPVRVAGYVPSWVVYLALSDRADEATALFEQWSAGVRAGSGTPSAGDERAAVAALGEWLADRRVPGAGSD